MQGKTLEEKLVNALTELLSEIRKEQQEIREKQQEIREWQEWFNSILGTKGIEIPSKIEINQYLKEQDINKDVQKHSPTPEVIKEEVYNTVQRIGVPVYLKGFRCIVIALQMIFEDPTRLDYITKYIYPEVAKKVSKPPDTADRVVRAIYYAIERTWEIGNMEEINKIFIYYNSSKAKPNNSEFLTQMYLYIKRKMK